ncbi:hypothetical protein ABZP36_008907 [Zizania latifolia]
MAATASSTIVCRVLVIAVAVAGLLFAAGESKVHLDYDYAFCNEGCEWPECYRQCRRVGYNYGRCYQNGPVLDCCCFGQDELAPAPAHAFLHP